jgi:hypothetical protein
MRSLKSFRKVRIGFYNRLGSIIVIVKVEMKGGVPKHVGPFG